MSDSLGGKDLQPRKDTLTTEAQRLHSEIESIVALGDSLKKPGVLAINLPESAGQRAHIDFGVYANDLEIRNIEIGQEDNATQFFILDKIDDLTIHFGHTSIPVDAKNVHYLSFSEPKKGVIWRFYISSEGKVLKLFETEKPDDTETRPLFTQIVDDDFQIYDYIDPFTPEDVELIGMALMKTKSALEQTIAQKDQPPQAS